MATFDPQMQVYDEKARCVVCRAQEQAVWRIMRVGTRRGDASTIADNPIRRQTMRSCSQHFAEAVSLLMAANVAGQGIGTSKRPSTEGWLYPGDITISRAETW